MALKVTKAELWSVTIDDQAGGAAGKIEPLSKAGANFEFVFARRQGRGLREIGEHAFAQDRGGRQAG